MTTTTTTTTIAKTSKRNDAFFASWREKDDDDDDDRDPLPGKRDSQSRFCEETKVAAAVGREEDALVGSGDARVERARVQGGNRSFVGHRDEQFVPRKEVFLRELISSVAGRAWRRDDTKQ